MLLRILSFSSKNRSSFEPIYFSRDSYLLALFILPYYPSSDKRRPIMKSRFDSLDSDLYGTNKVWWSISSTTFSIPLMLDLLAMDSEYFALEYGSGKGSLIMTISLFYKSLRSFFVISYLLFYGFCASVATTKCKYWGFGIDSSCFATSHIYLWRVKIEEIPHAYASSKLLKPCGLILSNNFFYSVFSSR